MFTFISRKTRAALKCFFFAKEIKRILIHSNENETFDSFIGGVHASRVAAEVAIVESAYPCRCTQCRNGADCFRFCWTKTSPSLSLSLSLYRCSRLVTVDVYYTISLLSLINWIIWRLLPCYLIDISRTMDDFLSFYWRDRKWEPFTIGFSYRRDVESYVEEVVAIPNCEA